MPDVSPSSASVSPGGSIDFEASGDGESFTWALSPNNSGGRIDSSGHYVAGSNSNVTDVVAVADDSGDIATASVTVTVQSIGAVSGGPTRMGRPPNQ